MNFWKLARKNGAEADIYEREVVSRIREKYSINQELATLRKELATLRKELATLRQQDTKPAEFAEYNAFVEDCKSEIKKEMEESGNE